jgi:hypothetical protein
MLSLAVSAADLCYLASIKRNYILYPTGAGFGPTALTGDVPTPSVPESNPTIKPTKSSNTR